VAGDSVQMGDLSLLFRQVIAQTVAQAAANAAQV